MKKTLAHRIALRGMLIAVAFVLSWLEARIPYFFAIPGMKLGLSNLVVLIALYKLGSKDAFCLNMLRILLVSFTFGNLFSLIYSAAGGMLSFLVMLLLKKKGSFSIRFVSVFGGIAHNVGQLLVAAFIVENANVFWYFPFLCISGVVAGAVIGLLCGFIVKRLPTLE